MSTRSALRRALAALAATGSLLPGVSGPTPSLGPTSTPRVPSPTALIPTAMIPRAAVSPGAGPADPLQVPTRTHVDASARTWGWPLSPRPTVIESFRAPRSTYGPGHRGLDLAARAGQPVVAVDDGVLTHVGVVAGRGTVSIAHASGLRSTYEPVRGVVAAGRPVSRGEVIGVVQGRSHCGGGCVHLGALLGEGYVDPRPLLGGGPVILLPLGRGR